MTRILACNAPDSTPLDVTHRAFVCACLSNSGQFRLGEFTYSIFLYQSGLFDAPLKRELPTNNEIITPSC